MCFPLSGQSIIPEMLGTAAACRPAARRRFVSAGGVVKARRAVDALGLDVALVVGGRPANARQRQPRRSIIAARRKIDPPTHRRQNPRCARSCEVSAFNIGFVINGHPYRNPYACLASMIERRVARVRVKRS
jgi:hypothetical protein